MGVKRDRPVAKIVRPFQAFADRASSGGILLIAATVVALVWANSPWGATYSELWQTNSRGSRAPLQGHVALCG